MAFGDSTDNEIVSAVFKKLDKWLNQPPDYDDVERAYNLRGRLQARRINLLRVIERAEDEAVLEHGKPRSNEARILKMNATKELRDELANLDAELALAENDCKLLEFRKAMFSAAVFRTKIQLDM